MPPTVTHSALGMLTHESCNPRAIAPLPTTVTHSASGVSTHESYNRNSSNNIISNSTSNSNKDLR